MAVIDLVKWNSDPEDVVWKFDSEELSTWTQLIVNESQEAFLVKGGVFEGPFGAGRHTLSTENLPGLRSLLRLPFGGGSPFSAEVWFVNKSVNLDVKWGTPDPIQLQDPKFGLMVPVRAFGQYGVQILDSKRFLNKIVGTSSFWSSDAIARYLNGELIKFIKQAIAQAIIGRRTSVLDVATQLVDISNVALRSLQGAVSDYGIAIPQFNIHSINMPEDDPAVAKLRDVLAMRTEIELLATNYQQMRSFDVLETAAGNSGAAGTLMGSGMGAGLGIGLGAAFAPAMNSIAGGLLPSQYKANPAALGPEQRLKMLKDLFDLKNTGALTEEEFALEKSKLLGNA